MAAKRLDKTTKVRMLRKALSDGRLVKRVRRKCDECSLDGFVVGVGEDWFVLHQMENAMLLNGFCALRIRDVNQLEPRAPNRTFLERSLRMRGCRKQKPHRIDLRSTRSIIETVQARYPVVTIHREFIKPDVCQMSMSRS